MPCWFGQRATNWLNEDRRALHGELSTIHPARPSGCRPIWGTGNPTRDGSTPAFMPVGTYGAVKGITPLDMGDGRVHRAQQHFISVRPGDSSFVTWVELTFHGLGWTGVDGLWRLSGISLRGMAKVTEEGVRFRTPLDGQYRTMTPEVCVGIQENLGVDMAMAFDECIEWPAERDRVAASTERTTRWLKRCIAARQHPDRTGLLGIVQGGFYGDLRAAHARRSSSSTWTPMPSVV